jgi:AcrR family transcriptional regulator
MRPTRAPGLRERKKAQTRAAIQRHALRLFREHSFSGTTMEQIPARSTGTSPPRKTWS